GHLPHRALDQLHRRRTPRRARPEESALTMTNEDLCFTPATRLVSMIRRRQVSPLEVTRAVLDRIERVNPVLNAYCTVAAERALPRGRRRERRRGAGRSARCTAFPCRSRI